MLGMMDKELKELSTMCPDEKTRKLLDLKKCNQNKAFLMQWMTIEKLRMLVL